MTIVAYHIETHRNPPQVERLVSTLLRWAPRSVVVVSHDERSAPLDADRLTSMGAVVLSSRGGYSDMSHARRWLETVDWLQRNNVEYDWLSNLSGQCYPVRPLDVVHAELATSQVDAYIETFDVFDPSQTPWGTARGRTRYTFQHRRLRRLTQSQMAMLRPLQVVNRLQPWVRLTTATGLTVGTRVEAPWGDDTKLYGGSFFTTLSSTAVERVLQFVQDRSDIIDFLGQSLAPAEVFFQTALGNDPKQDLRIENNCRRFFDFSQTRFNHPRTLTRDDLPAVFESGMDFARKFGFDGHAVSEMSTLDLVDRHLEQVSAGAVG